MKVILYYDEGCFDCVIAKTQEGREPKFTI